jgi:glycerophosphoryl diester phosphodiesterase
MKTRDISPDDLPAPAHHRRLEGILNPATGALMRTLATQIALAFTSGLASAPASQAAADWPDCNVVLVAHRGAAIQGYAENTLAAFRRAIENGAEAIEIDLRGTKDGEIVVMHDETVNRTTNGRGAVADRTLAELRKLDAGRGERIPTYEEVLQLVSGTGVTLLLDIKESQVLDGRKVVRMTEEHNAVQNVIVGVRSLDDLRAFRALSPRLRTLGFVKEVEDIEPFAKLGADIIRLWPKWLYANPALVDKVHQLGMPVWTTTGAAPRDELEKLIKLGVNGIISDRSAAMNDLFADMRKRREPCGPAL